MKTPYIFNERYTSKRKWFKCDNETLTHYHIITHYI